MLFKRLIKAINFFVFDWALNVPKEMHAFFFTKSPRAVVISLAKVRVQGIEAIVLCGFKLYEKYRGINTQAEMFERDSMRL